MMVELKRKGEQKWHFAEDVRCGWADHYTRLDEFTATKTIDSISALPAEFCGECKKRRRIRDDD